MGARPVREQLDRLVEELARARSEPPPDMFETSSGLVRRALSDAVGLEVSDAQLESALTGGRTPSGEWYVERCGGGELRFRRRSTLPPPPPER